MSREKTAPKPAPQPASKRTRAPKRMSFTDEVIRDLSTVKETDDNRNDLTALCDNLALWARYMMELNPAAAAPFYRAVIDAWEDNRAAGLYKTRDERAVCKPYACMGNDGKVSRGIILKSVL